MDVYRRIALHKYDPPDFLSKDKLTTTASPVSVPATPTPTEKLDDTNSPRESSSLDSSPISVFSQDSAKRSLTEFDNHGDDSDDDLL